MKRILSFAAIFIMLIAASACSGKKPPTPSAIKGNSVIKALQDLGHLYEKKNLPGFMNLISDSYNDRPAFSTALESVFAKYETVRFTIQYTKLIIVVDEKNMAKATFNWDSEWQTAGGNVQKNGGRVTFAFSPKDNKLVSIDGKNPFIPQPVENPGRQ